MSIKLLDFADIVAAVREELKYQASDTTSIDRIKRDINMVYINEVVPFKRWFWLRNNTTISQAAYIADGTVAVTPGSATVTFSVAPQASRKGDFFAVDNFSEIYRISEHEAGSTEATLDIAYNGTLLTEAAYKIWTDTLALPTNFKEAIEVWHDYNTDPMEPRGLQEFRRDVAKSPRYQGRPVEFTITDFVDPTPDTAETESDRYRVMKVYPAVSQYATPIHLDYIQEATELELDGDEPLMPISDRIVLVYGALARAWHRERNMESSALNESRFQQKLARMANDVDEGNDTPQLVPSSRYLSSRRSSRSSKYRGAPGTGGASYSAPTYLKDVRIDGATVTNNLTVSAGVTIDGRDISADGAVLDSLNAITANIETADRAVITDENGILNESEVTSSELTFLSAVDPLTTVTLTDATSGVIAEWAAVSFTTMTLVYSISRGAGNIESGSLTVVNDGTNISTSQGAIADLGIVGVSLSFDFDSGSIRLNYETTATGTDATFKFKAHKWAA